MTNYPYSFDNNITLPGVSGSSQEDVAITALRDAVFAIETELGITPSGVYPDVRTRLDILESRINMSVSPGFPSDGYVKSPLYIFNIPQNIMLSISDGAGAPTENRLDGSLYMRGGDGYANNQLYVRLNGAWYPVQTEQFTAANDLVGFPPGSDGHLAQTVVGLYNHPFRSTMDTVGSVQDGYHVTWNNTDGYWEAQTGFIPGHDLDAFSGPYGRTGQTVIGLQGFPLSGTAPTDGYVLVWQASDNRWEPQARAVVFDGYFPRVNLISNRAQQSPIDNTKTGIVNFGSKSTGTSTGATANYAAILSGDRHSVGGIFGLIVGGDNHTIDGIAQYGTILNGLTNTVSDQYSTVLNGTLNVVSGIQSTIINGTSNTVSGDNVIVNGTNITVDGDFSTVLNGNLNTISAATVHAAIISGHDNQITGGLAAEHSIILGGDTNTVDSANNVLFGTPSNSSSLGDFSVVLSGVSNTIATLSDYAAIISGNTNTISASSEYSFIGSGNNNLVSFHHSTILNGDTCSVSGFHGSILNGSNSTVTGSYGTIINGDNNSITGSFAYGLILDGYNNLVTGPGGFIADGYNNTVNGQYSSIINGNFNTINGRNSTILNGASNLIDLNSVETTVLTGEQNMFTNSSNSTAVGSSNIFTNAASTFVIGTINTIQSTASFVNGSNNTLSSGTSFNRVFGGSNIIGTGSSLGFVVGNSNQIVNSASRANILGSSNIVDGYSNATIFGTNNIVNANFGTVTGQYGKSRMFGQQVQANSRFTPGNIGEAQWSRLIMDGYAVGGSQFFLQLQDTTLGFPTNPTFLDGYSYDIQLRILIVNTSNIGTANGQQPVLPARMVYDILAHKESSDTNLILDNINETLITPNTADRTTRTPWTITFSISGNQLVIGVDAEIGSSQISTYNGGLLIGAPTSSSRRAVATLEMREISRI